MNIEKQFSHESMPDFQSVMTAIDKYFDHNAKPLSTRAGVMIHPKLKDLTFQFWAIPEVAPPEHPEIQANPKDFVAVTFEGDMPDERKQYLTGLVFRNFNEAQVELTKLAKELFGDDLAEENTEEPYSEAA